MPQLELWQNEFAEKKSKEQRQKAAQQQEGCVDEGHAAKRARVPPPAPMHMGFTSGSADGVVARMAEPQNLSRAAAFLAEGLIFLSWISEQSAGYKGLITQLTDRLLWDKVTVKDRYCNFTAIFLRISSGSSVLLFICNCSAVLCSVFVVLPPSDRTHVLLSICPLSLFFRLFVFCFHRRTAQLFSSPVGTAGPQPGTSRAQWALLDLNRQI